MHLHFVLFAKGKPQEGSPACNSINKRTRWNSCQSHKIPWKGALSFAEIMQASFPFGRIWGKIFYWVGVPCVQLCCGTWIGFAVTRERSFPLCVMLKRKVGESCSVHITHIQAGQADRFGFDLQNLFTCPARECAKCALRRSATCCFSISQRGKDCSWVSELTTSFRDLCCCCRPSSARV